MISRWIMPCPKEGVKRNSSQQRSDNPTMILGWATIRRYWVERQSDDIGVMRGPCLPESVLAKKWYLLHLNNSIVESVSWMKGMLQLIYSCSRPCLCNFSLWRPYTGISSVSGRLDVLRITRDGGCRLFRCPSRFHDIHGYIYIHSMCLQNIDYYIYI